MQMNSAFTVDGKERLVTYKEWADLIQASFEKCYYVPRGVFTISSRNFLRRSLLDD